MFSLNLAAAAPLPESGAGMGTER